MEILILLGLLDFQSLLYKELSKGEDVEKCLPNDFTEEHEVSREQNLWSGMEAGSEEEICLNKVWKSKFPHHLAIFWKRWTKNWLKSPNDLKQTHLDWLQS